MMSEGGVVPSDGAGVLKHAAGASETAAEDTVQNTPDPSPRSENASTVRSRSSSNTNTDSTSSSMAARSDDDVAALRAALLSRESIRWIDWSDAGRWIE